MRVGVDRAPCARAWYIFQEAIVRLPQKAAPYVLGMMLCFYLGWAGFGVLFAFGSEAGQAVIAS